MGNSHYRPTPRRTHSSEEGHFTFYDYGASQITGWRNKQEDRYICLPKFYEDCSLFAVYDGHGGEQVVQYLHRYLHQHILNELILHKDPELALYLGFLTCDNSLRNITQKELAVIQDDLEIEFDVADREERREVIFGLKGLISNNSVVSAISKDSAESTTATKDSTLDPGTSKGSSNPDLDDLKAEVFSACLNQLPSLFFLTQAPIEKDDESDEEYEPQKDNIKHNLFGTSGAEDEESVESDDSAEDEDEEESDGNGEQTADEEDNEIERMEIDESGESKYAKQSKDCEKESNETDTNVAEKKPENMYSPGCSTDKCISSESRENKTSKEQINANIFEDLNKPEDDQFGATCGSTATVLLLNEKKVYLANVGDSRCVACINGVAVELSIDHKPTREEEHARIINGGGTISQDDRVNGYLDMSRAFGDFGFKQKKVSEPFQVLSCEPYLATIDVTSDLEFIIVASDGIWNTMESCEVIDYLKNRMQDTRMELRDICGEMFEEMLPSEVTEDGSGCDNMTAILIQFKNFGKVNSITSTGLQECYKYYYPPQNKKKYFMPETDTSAKQRDKSPNQHSEKCKPQSKEITSSPPTPDDNCKPTPSDDSYESLQLINIISPSVYNGSSGSESFRHQSKRVESSQNSHHSEPLEPHGYRYDEQRRPIDIESSFSSDTSSDSERFKHQTTKFPTPLISKDHYEQLDPRGCSHEVGQSLQPSDNFVVIQWLLKSYEDLWRKLQSAREKIQMVDHDLLTARCEIKERIAGLGNLLPQYAHLFSGNPHFTSNNINPNVASTSKIDPNPVSSPNNGHFWDILRSLHNANESSRSEKDSVGQQNVDEPILVVDLSSDEDNIGAEGNSEANNKTQSNPTQAEDDEELSNSIKSADHTDLNEDHK